MDNVIPRYRSQYTIRRNSVNDVPYDYSSIMHYSHSVSGCLYFRYMCYILNIWLNYILLGYEHGDFTSSTTPPPTHTKRLWLGGYY